MLVLCPILFIALKFDETNYLLAQTFTLSKHAKHDEVEGSLCRNHVVAMYNYFVFRL